MQILYSTVIDVLCDAMVRHLAPLLRGHVWFKNVPLDLEVVSEFFDAYLQFNPLELFEVVALPALLAARPLKRAIGKYRSMIEEARVSQGHVRKTAQEIARVCWLEAHGQELRRVLWGTPQAAS